MQGVSNLAFHGHDHHWGGWPVLSLAALPSTELKNPVYSFRAESTGFQIGGMATNLEIDGI